MTDPEGHLKMVVKLKQQKLQTRIELRDWSACEKLTTELVLLENIFIGLGFDVSVFDFRGSTPSTKVIEK